MVRNLLRGNFFDEFKVSMIGYPKVVITVIAILMIFIYGSSLSSKIFSDFGMLYYKKGLSFNRSNSQYNQVSRDTPLFTETSIEPYLETADRLLHLAYTLDPDSSTTRWEIGRLALTKGDFISAADILFPVMPPARYNPRLYEDTILAFSLGGKPDQAIKLYNSVPPINRTQVISDSISVAYLETQGLSGLKEAHNFRPEDLYVNYYLWKDAKQSGDITNENSYFGDLQSFILKSIDPTNARLLDYTAEVIPLLLADKIWDQAKTRNVVSYLVWQVPESSGVEGMLRGLQNNYPSDQDWQFLLAELYHRRGDLERARVAYEQVISNDPEYSPAYLRLGTISEMYGQIYKNKANEFLQDALKWYSLYHKLRPNDLLGLTRLAAVENKLGLVDADRLATDLEQKVDDRQIAANLLGISSHDLTLGPSLVENSKLEIWDRGTPSGWMWVPMFSHDSFQNALFFGGSDNLDVLNGDNKARIIGFWIDTGQGKGAARAGYWALPESKAPAPIRLLPRVPYLLSFDYRTKDIPNSKSLVWVSSNPEVFWAQGRGLPATNGEWHHFVAIGWNRTSVESVIRPNFEAWAQGDFEFDNVQVRMVHIGGSNVIIPGEALFHLK